MKRLAELLVSDEAGFNFAKYVKYPLMMAISSLLGQYPEPTRGNTFRGNALAWMDIRDEYLKYEENVAIQAMAKVFFDLIICEYEHDSPYEERIDSVAKQLVMAYLTGNYVLRSRPPASLWSEPLSKDVEAEEQMLKAEILKALKAEDFIHCRVLQHRLTWLLGGREESD